MLSEAFPVLFAAASQPGSPVLFYMAEGDGRFDMFVVVGRVPQGTDPQEVMRLAEPLFDETFATFEADGPAPVEA